MSSQPSTARGTQPPLLRLLHISDLHIGSLVRSGRHPYNATIGMSQYLPLLKGLLGHTQVALERLVELLHDLEQQPGPLQIVVTGDLTAHGAPDHFENARKFLTNTLNDAHLGEGPGLKRPDALDYAISGNHDQYPGTGGIHGEPPVDLWKTFCPPLFPWVSPPLRLGNAGRLVFIRLDSDGDVHPFGARRTLARGHCWRQCEMLRQHLGQCPPREIRVLLMHHSHARHGPHLSLSRRSREAVRLLVRDAGIAITLTGHTHTEYLSQGYAGPTGVEEGRCGTTTQRDRYGRLLRSSLGPFLPKLDKNVALLHALHQNGSGVSWQTTVYHRPKHRARFETKYEANPVKVL